MARKHYRCSPERFVEVWQQSKDSDEAAAALGMPKAILHARAATYRRRGIHLKHMPKGPKRLDIEGLKRLAERLRPQADETETGVGDDGSLAF